MNILDALDDPNVFGVFFRAGTWDAWRVFLAALFGLPMTDDQLVTYRRFTGRSTPPTAPLHEAWLVCGRRGGKSFVLATIAVFLAAFKDWRRYLAPGEVGVIMIIAADRRQARVIMRYCIGLLKGVPMLAKLICAETRETIELRNRITIEIHTASFRTTRGYTIVAALLDELAYWATDEASAEPDHEVINAVRPGMASIPDAVLLKEGSQTSKLAADSDWYDQEITLTDARGFRVGDGVCLRARNPDTKGLTVVKRTLVACSGNRFKLDRPLRENLWQLGEATASTLFPILSGENIADVVIEDITLDGNKENNANLDGNYAGCVFLQDCKQIALRGVTARRYNGDGISWQICHDVTVENCHSHDNAGLGLHPGSGSQRPVIRGNRLGDDRNSRYEAKTTELIPGDVVIWYTDGIVECENASGEEYGEKRFRASVKRAAALDAGEMRDAIVGDATAFFGDTPRKDDITMIVGRIH